MYLTIIHTDSKKGVDLETEDNTIIIEKIKNLDFTKDFELILVKDNSCLNLNNDAEVPYLYFSTDHKIDYPKLDFNLKEKERAIGIFENYIKDKDFKRTEQIFIALDQRENDLKSKKYKAWKAQYDERVKKERFNFLKPIAYTIILAGILSTIIYYVYSGEYKFIAQETTFVNAIIDQPSRAHMGKGIYAQKIRYHYSFEDYQFNDHKILFRNVGYLQKGDSLKLKISVSHPNRNMIIGFY